MDIGNRIFQTLELVRRRNDNPLAWYGRPDRSFGRGLKFWGFILLIALASLVYGSILDRDGPSDAPVTYCVTCVISGFVLSFLSLYLFGHSHRGRHHLEDLHMTPLSRRQVVFGSVWWGIVASVFAFIPMFLVSLWLETIHWSEGDGTDALGRLLLIAFVFVYGLGLALRVWIDHGPRLIKTAFFAFGLHLASAFLLYFWAMLLTLALMSTFSGNAFYSAGDQLGWIIVLGSILLAALRWGVLAARFAGNRFFALIDPESLAWDSWAANEQLARKDKPLRRTVLKRFREQWRGGWSSDVRGIFAGFLTLALGGVVGWGVAASRGMVVSSMGAVWGIVGAPSIFAASIISVAASLLFRARGRDDTPFPLVAGAGSAVVFRSILVPCFPFFLALMAMGILDPLAHDVQFPEAFGGLLAAAVGICFMALIATSVASTLLPRGRRSLIGAIWLLAAIGFELFPLLSMDPRHRQESFSFCPVMNWGATLYLYYGLAFTTWIALGIGWASQRLHVRELRYCPRNTLTTDPLVATKEPEMEVKREPIAWF